MGAAVENDKITKGFPLYQPTKYCKGVYVFRSEDDGVLRILHTALGYTGPKPIDKTFDTVRVVNCSGLQEPIKHGSYKHRSEIYNFMYDNPDISSIGEKQVALV